MEDVIYKSIYIKYEIQLYLEDMIFNSIYQIDGEYLNEKNGKLQFLRCASRSSKEGPPYKIGFIKENLNMR